MAEGQSAAKTPGRKIPVRKTSGRKLPKRAPKVQAQRSAKPRAKPSAETPAIARLRVVHPDEGRARKRNAAAAASRRSLFLLLIPAGVLLVVGLIMVLSAGSISAVEGYGGNAFWYFQRQLIYAVAGGIALVVAWRLPYSIWKRLALPMLLVTIPLMLIALRPSSGTALYGASRWIDLGPVTLQPSEFMKLALIAFSATVLSAKRKKLHIAVQLLIPLAPVTLLVAGLVILQRDLGTTLILCGTVFLMMFVAGVRGKHLSFTAAGGALAAALLIFGESYRRTRFIDAWLNPMADAKGAGYQLIQGLIALGSGGWFGVGLGNSRQKWDYLPNAHSDFIFAIIGEELGLIGALFVMAAFALLLYAGIRIALRAPDTFGRLLAAGITSWFGLQVIINLGAVTGLLPITGVPLPLVSFGGTALVVTLAGIGVLASVARCSGVAGDAKAKARARAKAPAKKAPGQKAPAKKAPAKKAPAKKAPAKKAPAKKAPAGSRARPFARKAAR